MGDLGALHSPKNGVPPCSQIRPTTLRRVCNDNGSATAKNRMTASSKIRKRDLQARIAALEAQTLRYKVAIDNISQGICFFDDEERLILCNRRYAEMYRLSPGQLRPGARCGKSWSFMRPPARSRIAGIDSYLAFSRSINSGTGSRTWTAELKDGRTIQISHEPMPGGGWVSSHEDITEMRASARCEDERISLQALIDAVPGYLWVKDTESRFVVVNRALASDSGRQRTSDMIGLSDFDIHAPRSRARVSCP